MDSSTDLTTVLSYLEKLQDSICNSISAIDGKDFIEDRWEREEGGGGWSNKGVSQGPGAFADTAHGRRSDALL